MSVEAGAQTPVEDAAWSASDTTPGAVDAALRHLLAERHAEAESYAPARVVNLVVVADHARRDEVVARFERAGRNHPSRVVLCTVERGRSTLDATATMTCEVPPPGGVAPCRERVEITVGEEHLAHLDTIVASLLVSDLDTMVWAPHGHLDALDSLLRLADSVLVDSAGPADPREGLARAAELGVQGHVVDLSWLRGAPWRERIAAAFDPPQWRPALRELSSVGVRHHPDSTAGAALLVGWLADRLQWRTEALTKSPEDGAREGLVRACSGEVVVRLEADPELEVPGLAGVVVEAASGLRLALDRGPGGLAARRRMPDGRESSWVVLGASRGEGGILGEGIRQALLRSTLGQGALEHARALVG